MTRAAPYLVVAVVTAVYLIPFVRMFCDAPDAGVFLNGADLVSRGALPSRDFVEPQGPGSFLWLALFFRIFGSSLTTARVVLDLTGMGIGLLAFWLSRRLGATGLPAALFAVALSVPLLPINSPHYDSNLFAMGALAVFVAAWEEERRRWMLAVAAMLCGLTTWMIQQKGLYLVLGLLICLAVAKRGKALVWLAAIYLAVALLPFGVYTALHALPDVLFANYVWPLQKYGELNAAPYGFPAWRNLVSEWNGHANFPMARTEDVATSVPFLMVAALPIVLPLAGRGWFRRAMLPYWLGAYAIWLGELHRLDIGHLRNGVMLMAVLFFSICETSAHSGLRRLGLGISVFVALTAGTNLMASLLPDRLMETRRGLIPVEDNGALLEFLNRHTRVGEAVLVYPYQPLYYFVEQLRNPTRYSYLQYHLHTDGQFREATRDLDRQQVRYVVFDRQLSGERFRDVFPAYRQPEKARLIMEPYLEQHYRVAAELGRFQILERRFRAQ